MPLWRNMGGYSQSSSLLHAPQLFQPSGIEGPCLPTSVLWFLINYCNSICTLPHQAGLSTPSADRAAWALPSFTEEEENQLNPHAPFPFHPPGALTSPTGFACPSLTHTVGLHQQWVFYTGVSRQNKYAVVLDDAFFHSFFIRSPNVLTVYYTTATLPNRKE